MINKPLPFHGLNIRIPIIIPTRGGVINHGSALGFRVIEGPQGAGGCVHEYRTQGFTDNRYSISLYLLALHSKASSKHWGLFWTSAGRLKIYLREDELKPSLTVLLRLESLCHARCLPSWVSFSMPTEHLSAAVYSLALEGRMRFGAGPGSCAAEPPGWGRRR